MVPPRGRGDGAPAVGRRPPCGCSRVMDLKSELIFKKKSLQVRAKKLHELWKFGHAVRGQDDPHPAARRARALARWRATCDAQRATCCARRATRDVRRATRDVSLIAARPCRLREKSEAAGDRHLPRPLAGRGRGRAGNRAASTTRTCCSGVPARVGRGRQPGSDSPASCFPLRLCGVCAELGRAQQE